MSIFIGTDTRLVVQGITGRDGSFEVRATTGEHDFGVDAPGWVGHVFGSFALPGEEPVDFELDRAGEIAGTVVGADGKPVAGVRLVALDDDGDEVMRDGRRWGGRTASCVLGRTMDPDPRPDARTLFERGQAYFRRNEFDRAAKARFTPRRRASSDSRPETRTCMQSDPLRTRRGRNCQGSGRTRCRPR